MAAAEAKTLETSKTNAQKITKQIENETKMINDLKVKAPAETRRNQEEEDGLKAVLREKIELDKTQTKLTKSLTKLNTDKVVPATEFKEYGNQFEAILER